MIRRDFAHSLRARGDNRGAYSASKVWRHSMSNQKGELSPDVSARTIVQEERTQGAFRGEEGRRRSEAPDTFPERIRERVSQELFSEAQHFIRRHPALVAGMAAGLGFVAYRLLSPSWNARTPTRGNGRREIAGRMNPPTGTRTSAPNLEQPFQV